MENSKNSFLGGLNLIKAPLVTEKAISFNKSNKYAFLVDKSLKKAEIRLTLEKMFNVTITSVKTCILPPKVKRVGKSSGRKACYKKAYITLKEGDTIEALFN